MKKSLLGLSLMVVVLVLASCSATKYVPEGSYLLDEVQIRTDDKRVRPSALSMYVRQNPNAKWFSLIKTQLYVYNWSGADSTRWINRALRKMGDPPVIYSSEETARSAEEMEKAVRNMGFMGATVSTEREVSHKKLKLTLPRGCRKALPRAKHCLRHPGRTDCRLCLPRLGRHVAVRRHVLRRE